MNDYDGDEFNVYPVEDTRLEKLLIWGSAFIAVITGLALVFL